MTQHYQSIDKGVTTVLRSKGIGVLMYSWFPLKKMGMKSPGNGEGEQGQRLGEQMYTRSGGEKKKN